MRGRVERGKSRGMTDQELVSKLRLYTSSALPLAADRIEALTKERDEARRDVDEGTERIAAREASWSVTRDDLRKAFDRIDALTKERDEARTHLGDVSRLLSTERLNHAETRRDVEAVQSQCRAWKRSTDACAAERNEARSEVHRIRAALGCVQFEPADDAAKRVVRERDEARNAFGRARNEASFQAAKSSALDSELRNIENDRDALRLRYDALFSQSIHLAREVDRSNTKKADRVEAAVNLTNALDKARTALIKIAIESGHFAKLPAETRSCELCQGKERAPWPPAVGKGPTHHTCYPGEEASALLERTLTGPK